MYEVKWECITPDMAEAYLLHNTNNRPLSERWAGELSRFMARGEFLTNGDSIRFSQSGVLLNGQHTLRAIVLCGIPQTLLVVRGLPDETFGTMDRGRKRMVSHDLARRGFRNTTRLAAVTQLLWTYEKYGCAKTRTEGKLSSLQVAAVCEAIPSIPECVEEFRDREPAPSIVTPAIGTMLWFATRHYPEKRGEFFGILHAELPATKTHPAFALRDRMQFERSTKKRVSDNYATAIAIKAWNHFTEEREVKCLKVDEREAFPVIVGYGNELTSIFPQWK